MFRKQMQKSPINPRLILNIFIKPRYILYSIFSFCILGMLIVTIILNLFFRIIGKNIATMPTNLASELLVVEHTGHLKVNIFKYHYLLHRSCHFCIS